MKYKSTLTRLRAQYLTLLKYSCSAFLLLAVLATGCKKVSEEPGLTGICPEIISTDPANGATDVSLSTTVVATFNEVMDPATINNTTFTLTGPTGLIAGTVSYSGVDATFTPATNLLLNTLYTATITNQVKDPQGNAMISNYVWSFTTTISPDITRPYVISTDPVNGATGVVLNKKLAATFSEAMNPATLSTTTFLLSDGINPITGTVTYSGVTAIFSPASNLTANTVYTATITTGAEDVAGNSLVSNYVWTFTTGTVSDVIAPTVISTDPSNLETGVMLNKRPSATFSEVMNASTLNASTFTLKNGLNAVSGIVSYSGVSATFTPLTNLLPNTVYTATITTGAQDLAGNALAANYVWTFTTGATSDVVPPTVISTDPINAATSVPLNKKVSATFSEVMRSSTINNTTFLLRQGTTSITGVVTYSGTTALFSPSSNLLPGLTYTATITTGARDLANNALVANYVWTFSTGTSFNGPNLGSAAIYGVFGGSAGITNQGLNTMINNGSIGTTGVSTMITGLHDMTTGDIYTETPLNKGGVSGRIYTAPPLPGTATSFAIATQGLIDATIAYNSISPASQPGGTDPGAGELGGLTLPPGIYKSASGTFNITNGPLTLDAMGNPNAVWIFQTAAGLTVGIAGPAGARSVNMINGGLPGNVFWYVGSAATINAAGGGIMTGTIIASAGVTFSTADNAVQTVLNGRALSLNASVTLVNTTINVP